MSLNGPPARVVAQEVLRMSWMPRRRLAFAGGALLLAATSAFAAPQEPVKPPQPAAARSRPGSAHPGDGSPDLGGRDSPGARQGRGRAGRRPSQGSVRREPRRRCPLDSPLRHRLARRRAAQRQTGRHLLHLTFRAYERPCGARAAGQGVQAGGVSSRGSVRLDRRRGEARQPEVKINETPRSFPETRPPASP